MVVEKKYNRTLLDALKSKHVLSLLKSSVCDLDESPEEGASLHMKVRS